MTTDTTADTTTRRETDAQTESTPLVDPGIAEGRSRLLLFGGMGWLAIGSLVGEGLVVWGGGAIVAAALALNTAGKLAHYRRLPVPRRDRLLLSATWTALALTVVALLGSVISARYGAGDGAFFWSLAVGGVGFGLLHVAAQATYLPESAGES